MKEFKFDEEGRLIHDDSLGTPTSEDYREIRQLEAKYNRTIPDVNRTDEFIRTIPGIASRGITETVDLQDMLSRPTPLQKLFMSKEDKQRAENIQDAKQKVISNYLTTFYNTVFGEENVEQEQRGEGKTLPIVKQPQGTGKQVIRTVGDFAAAFAGAKGAKPFKEGAEKLFKSKTVQKRVPITKDTANLIVQSEVATQFAFNPYDGSLVSYLGKLISDDNEALADLKLYLEQDPQENTQLKNRMMLLGEGLAIGGGLVAAGKGAIKAGEKTGLTNKAKLSVRKIKDTGKGFVLYLENLRKQGSEAVDDFFTNLEKSRDISTAQKKVALKHRDKDIKEGKITEGAEGDIKALEPGPIAEKLGFKNNLLFSDNSFIRRLESFRRKTLTTRGTRTRQLYEKYLKSENYKEAWNDNIANVGYNMEVAIENILEITSKYKNKEELQKKINYVLFTDFRSPTLVTGKSGIKVGRRQKPTFEQELNKLPKDLRQPLRDARKLQDELSDEMINTGTLTQAQKKIYEDQKGFYVRRSFKLYEDPNYIPANSVVKEAENFLTIQIKKNNPELDDDEILLRVNAEIADILDSSAGKNIGQRIDKFERIRKEILKGKQEIPSEIRRLMGEVTDPTQAIIHSTTKLANYVENVKFYDDAFDGGAGIYFRENKEGIFKEVIPEGYGKLSGRYTSPELLKYFSNYKKKSQQWLEDEGILGASYRNVLLLKGLSQAAKTVYSHTTHVKNVAGGAQMSLANGINVFDVKQTLEIRKILKAKTSNNRELQKFHEELSSLGLLNKGVVARDLQGLANDLGKVKKGVVAGNVQKVFDANIIPYYSFKKGKFTTTSVSRTGEKAQNAYIAEDDFFKINMYLREKDYLTKMNSKVSDGSTYKMTEQEIKERAARMVRDTLPNYDLVPELLQDLRRTPFFGRFFSFMAESVRISGNSIMNGIKEVKLGNQMIREGQKEAGNEIVKRGTLRLASFTAMAGVGAKGAEKATQVASGFTTDLVDAAKDLLPDYMQNSNVIVSVAPDGSPVIANLSSWDAYDFPKKPVQVLINKYLSEDTLDEDGLAKDVFSTIFQETVSPFLGESIIQEQLSNYFVRNGKTIDGKQMKNPFNKLDIYQDTGTLIGNYASNLSVLMSNVMESITPGSITRGTDLYETLTMDDNKTDFNQDVYEAQAFLKFVTGWGMQPLNKEYVETVYGFKANGLVKKKGKLRNEIYAAIDSDFNIDRFTNQYIDVNTRYYKEVAKFHKLSDSVSKFNVMPLKVLRDTNMAKSDMVSFLGNKTFKPIGITDNMKLQLVDAAPDYRTFINVYKDILTIDGELSKLPLYYSPDNYKAQKETIQEVKETLRENYKIGGKVPNVQEDPADRKNPYLGESYKETSSALKDFQKALSGMMKPKEEMERLGFSKGGSTRVDGTKKSLRGWLGPIKNNVTGQTMTEVSMGIGPEDNQKLIPLLVPTLNKKEIESLQNMKIEGNIKNIPQSIKDKAILHAQEREKQGLNVFYKSNKRVAFEKGGGTLKSDEAMYLKFYKLAKQAGNEFPEAVAAQASLESGHGKSELTTQYKNPLGIKVNRASERKEGQQAVQMKTQEFVKGKEGTYKEPFRVYKSLADSFVGYRQKVSAPRYDSIRQAKTSDEYLINIAKSGYATDPKYSEKTINIKNRYAHLIPQE